MKPLVLEDRFLLTEMRVANDQQYLDLKRVLVDTCSERTILSKDHAFHLQLISNEEVDEIEILYRSCSTISVGPLKIKDFELEIRGIKDEPHLDAVLGLDFLKRVGAKINLDSMTLSGSRVI